MRGQSTRFRLFLAASSGALLAASAFPEIHSGWLAWLAPGLMLWACYSPRAGSVFCAGYCAGLGYGLICFYWLLLIPFPWCGVAAWLVLSALVSFYVALWCSACWYLFPKPKSREKSNEEVFDFKRRFLTPGGWQRGAWSFSCAAAWAAMEMAAGRVVSGYPVISLGVSQFRLVSLIQIASVTGVYGVSFLVAWLSLCLMGAVVLWRQRAHRISSTFIQLLPPAVVIGCVVIYGNKVLSRPEKTAAQLKIALVQPAFPERIIWEPEEATNRFLKLVELSRQALASKPDLLVWPEAALPEIIGRNRYTQETIEGLVRPAKVWMVMGLDDIRPRAGEPGKYDAFNSAFLIDTNGDLAGVYDKSHLMIFGEYMPWWMRQLPFLAKHRRAAEIKRGEHAAALVMKAPQARFPVSICYEDCFPAEIRGRVDEDTDFILNLTNDGWFDESAAQWLHAETALFRAVENGVPLVRCCNNGLTCWVDANGRLHEVYFGESGNIYQAGYKIAEVPLRNETIRRNRTFYHRHGDWFGWSCMGLVALGLVIKTGRRFIVSRL